MYRGRSQPLAKDYIDKEDLQFRASHFKGTRALPQLVQQPEIGLSIIIPAYNETLRLPAMLDDCLNHMQSRTDIDFEILIVDDGSIDGTSAAALEYASKRSPDIRAPVRVVRLARNRGKGAAVTHVRPQRRPPVGALPCLLDPQGMLHARGRLLLFADADGATRFADLSLLEGHIKDLQKHATAAIAIGSRAHMVTTAAVVQRSFLRNLLMRSFHMYLQLLGVSAVKDTQCGFKLFTREAAQLVFPNVHTACSYCPRRSQTTS